MCHWREALFRAACLWLIAAALSLFAENPVRAEDSRLPPRPAALHDHGLLDRLLNWPEKEKSADENNEDETTEEPLESDRPDFTESSATVPLGRLQIESGYTYTQGVAGDPSHNVHDLPELLVRCGVAERLELRVAWDEGMMFEFARDPDSGRMVAASGSADLVLGFKYALTRQDHWKPQSAIIAAVTAPVGASFLTSGQVDAVINGLYSWELSKKLSLGCSTGSGWTAEPGDRFTQVFQSATLGYGLSQKLHAYNEWYALWPVGSDDNRPQHYYDGGLTYLVTPNLQLDWRAGVGLSDASDRFFTGCGFVFRR